MYSQALGIVAAQKCSLIHVVNVVSHVGGTRVMMSAIENSVFFYRVIVNHLLVYVLRRRRSTLCVGTALKLCRLSFQSRRHCFIPRRPFFQSRRRCFKSCRHFFQSRRYRFQSLQSRLGASRKPAKSPSQTDAVQT